MIRILLALVILAVLYYMNPLTKMDSAKLDEKKRSSVEKQVNDVQQQVDYAKKMAHQEFENNEEEE